MSSRIHSQIDKVKVRVFLSRAIVSGIVVILERKMGTEMRKGGRREAGKNGNTE